MTTPKHKHLKYEDRFVIQEFLNLNHTFSSIVSIMFLLLIQSFFPCLNLFFIGIYLADNGTEFSDLESIELSLNSGERLSSMFYCDPNCSWQKGSLEKNHEYIRYILPKGTSFAGITQDDANLLASHINSVPRLCLNNQSPYNAAIGFIGKNNMDLEI